jgi:hypothetical protein
VQAQSWVLEELPGVLGAAGMKHWIGAPGEALALRAPDQGRPRDLGSRAQACLLGQSPEEMSWRPQWAETTLGSRSWMKSEPRERSQEDKDQCVQLEQGYPEQVRTDGHTARPLNIQERFCSARGKHASGFCGLEVTLTTLPWP